jgi:hypothetical protein
MTNLRTTIRNFIIDVGSGSLVPSIASLMHNEKKYEMLVTIPGAEPLCIRCKGICHFKRECTARLSYANAASGSVAYSGTQEDLGSGDVPITPGQQVPGKVSLDDNSEGSTAVEMVSQPETSHSEGATAVERGKGARRKNRQRENSGNGKSDGAGSSKDSMVKGGLKRSSTNNEGLFDGDQSIEKITEFNGEP